MPEDWRDDELAEKWMKVRLFRRVVLGALEKERAEKGLVQAWRLHQRCIYPISIKMFLKVWMLLT